MGARVLVLACLGASLLGSCAHQEKRPPWGIVALHQGTEKAVMHVALPDIHVTNGRLNLTDGILSGTLAWGSLNVDIHDDHAQGFGWCGPVELVISKDGETL